MAKILFASPKGDKEVKVMSMQHVRAAGDDTIALEMPFYTPEGGAEGVYLTLSKQEALELASRLITKVSEEMR